MSVALDCCENVHVYKRELYSRKAQWIGYRTIFEGRLEKAFVRARLNALELLWWRSYNSNCGLNGQCVKKWTRVDPMGSRVVVRRALPERGIGRCQ